MWARLWRPAVRLVRPFNDGLKLKLTPHQYYITQGKGKERPFSGEYWNNHDLGTYHCVVCREMLFSSLCKFYTDTGYATFFAPEANKVTIVASEHKEKEVQCAHVSLTQCHSHIGHVFEEKRPPTNLHFQIMSAALLFQAKPWFVAPPSKNQRRQARAKSAEPSK